VKIKTKKCTGECGEVKSLTLFHRHIGNKSGRAGECAECVKRRYRAKSARDCKVCKKKKPSADFPKIRGINCNETCKECSGITPKKTPEKIHCIRGRGYTILKSECLPGCNPSCFECQYFTKDATVNSITVEASDANKYDHPSHMSTLTYPNYDGL
jgi:hypothetical protein